MKLYGSLVNRLYETQKGSRPEVGMGATELCYSDRHPFTIVKVWPSGKTIEVQEDRATRLDDHGMSELQVYSYEPNPDAPRIRVRWTGAGWKEVGGNRFRIGVREEYYDFTK